MDERSCPNSARAAKFLVAGATTLRCGCNQTATGQIKVQYLIVNQPRETMLQQQLGKLHILALI
jgi:hypothetical protein